MNYSKQTPQNRETQKITVNMPISFPSSESKLNGQEGSRSPLGRLAMDQGWTSIRFKSAITLTTLVKDHKIMELLHGFKYFLVALMGGGGSKTFDRISKPFKGLRKS